MVKDTSLLEAALVGYQTDLARIENAMMGSPAMLMGKPVLFSQTKGHQWAAEKRIYRGTESMVGEVSRTE